MEVAFALNGKHNISICVGCGGGGHSFGRTIGRDRKGSRATLCRHTARRSFAFCDGFTVINDSYITNPAALLSMIETLVEGSPRAKRKIVVAGAMLELGENEKSIHAETGARIARAVSICSLLFRGLAREWSMGRHRRVRKCRFREGF